MLYNMTMSFQWEHFTWENSSRCPAKVDINTWNTVLFENFTGPQEAAFNGAPKKLAASIPTYLNPLILFKTRSLYDDETKCY